MNSRQVYKALELRTADWKGAPRLHDKTSSICVSSATSRASLQDMFSVRALRFDRGSAACLN
ncbi:hypothetical protein E2C01_067240 [Portunus trituberculatus]|uniref:Uncharacterized protein n=1 Tax=Portunus trituberculatus TaxID=210409 RepID=A0A5B7HT84_PORTR|nr:hypothetical protein [Portunus trituberculatus]